MARERVGFIFTEGTQLGDDDDCEGARATGSKDAKAFLESGTPNNDKVKITDFTVKGKSKRSKQTKVNVENLGVVPLCKLNNLILGHCIAIEGYSLTNVEVFKVLHILSNL